MLGTSIPDLAAHWDVGFRSTFENHTLKKCWFRDPLFKITKSLLIHFLDSGEMKKWIFGFYGFLWISDFRISKEKWIFRICGLDCFIWPAMYWKQYIELVQYILHMCDRNCNKKLIPHCMFVSGRKLQQNVDSTTCLFLVAKYNLQLRAQEKRLNKCKV